jgi:hypothetical protein
VGLIAHQIEEMLTLQCVGVPPQLTTVALTALGVMELTIAAALLVAWSRAWPSWLCFVSMPIATAIVAAHMPAFFEARLNPVALNASLASLAAVDLLVLEGVPSASRCLRHPGPKNP